MQEALLHYLFDKKILGNEFLTTDGKSLFVENFGTLNQNAGPDFLNAKITINETTWAGHIEFHVKSSDWNKHQHQHDPAYNNVIAHFVYEHDLEIKSGEYILPTVELKKLVHPSFQNRYEQFISSRQKIPCQEQLSLIDPEIISNQLELALYQRLQRKSTEILELINETKGDYKKVERLIHAKIFGGKVNAEPFKMLADSLSMNWFAKLDYDIIRTDALIFGMAGYLPLKNTDIYCQKLNQEWRHIQQLFKPPILKKEVWKYSKMRPNSFPPIRLAQFAAFIRTKNANDPNHSLQLNPFWETHYRFENECKSKGTQLSETFKNLLQINVVVPLLFSKGVHQNDNDLISHAIKLLKSIDSEKNRHITFWQNLGITPTSAYESQALIEQRNAFCNEKKCLFCKIGNQLLTN